MEGGPFLPLALTTLMASEKQQPARKGFAERDGNGILALYSNRRGRLQAVYKMRRTRFQSTWSANVVPKL